MIGMIPARVSAADKTLTLICRRDDIVLTGMQWKIYKVGERREGDFVLTGEFAGYPVYLKDMTESDVADAAKTLESYAIADGIQPIAAGKTDTNGELAFTGLEDGLYLATGKILKVDSVYYVPSSLLIEVRNEGASFSYDAYPKFYFATLSEESKTYKVKKVWIDNDDAYFARPTYVTVDLYCEGELRDTITLNESNNWEYQWLDLDPLAEWRVVEREIPVKYGVVIDFNETQYLIKNSYGKTPIIDSGEEVRTTASTSVTTIYGGSGTDPTAPPVTTAGGRETTAVKPPETTTDSDISGTTGKAPAVTTTTTVTGLIQTGQIWWPVIPLIGGGLLLIAAGIKMRPKKDE